MPETKLLHGSLKGVLEQQVLYCAYKTYHHFYVLLTVQKQTAVLYNHASDLSIHTADRWQRALMRHATLTIRTEDRRDAPNKTPG